MTDSTRAALEGFSEVWARVRGEGGEAEGSGSAYSLTPPLYGAFLKRLVDLWEEDWRRLRLCMATTEN